MDAIFVRTVFAKLGRPILLPPPLYRSYNDVALTTMERTKRCFERTLREIRELTSVVLTHHARRQQLMIELKRHLEKKMVAIAARPVGRWNTLRVAAYLS